jgi:hypothetical protein
VTGIYLALLISLPDSGFAVARLFRGEGFPPAGRKNPASEEAGYNLSRDRSQDVNKADLSYPSIGGIFLAIANAIAPLWRANGAQLTSPGQRPGYLA